MKEQYIRKRQIKRLKYIRWICISVYDRLEKEVLKTKSACKRRNYEQDIFYAIYRFVSEKIKETEQCKN